MSIQHTFSEYKQLIYSRFIRSRKLVENRVVINSTQNNNFNFNSKYLFEYYLTQNDKDLVVKFVINDDIKRKNLTFIYGDHFIETNTYRGIKYVLKAKMWVCSNFNTPVTSFQKHDERIVLYLGHGVPFKQIGLAENGLSTLKRLYRKFRLRPFTHATSYSENSMIKDVISRMFDRENLMFLPLGEARNDTLELQGNNDTLRTLISGLPSFTTSILYAPTWRPYASTQILPFSDMSPKILSEQLEQLDIVLFIRTHPFFPSVVDEEFLNLDRVVTFDSNIAPEVMDYLLCFDSLITDYSSIYFNFLPLKRPIIFLPYDLDDYINKVGIYFDYHDMTPGNKPCNCEEFFTSLKDVAERRNTYENQIIKVNNMINGKTNGNCADCYDSIKSLLTLK